MDARTKSMKSITGEGKHFLAHQPLEDNVLVRLSRDALGTGHWSTPTLILVYLVFRSC